MNDEQAIMELLDEYSLDEYGQLDKLLTLLEDLVSAHEQDPELLHDAVTRLIDFWYLE